jgi:hypothetical protein
MNQNKWVSERKFMEEKYNLNRGRFACFNSSGRKRFIKLQRHGATGVILMSSNIKWKNAGSD